VSTRTVDTIGGMLELAARRAPDHVALRDGPDSRTYGQWNERSTRLANALLAQGLQAGDRVGAWFEDCLEYLELYGAIAKAGLIIVPVNRRLTPTEASYQLEQSGAVALIFSASLQEVVGSLELPEAIRVLVAVGDSDTEALDFERLIADGSPIPPPPPDEDSVFMICYTSGTTGFPKGAMLTHRNAKNGARTQMVGLRVPSNGVSIHTASLSFPATVTSHVLTHLYAGGTTVLLGKFDVERLIHTVEENRATFTYVPSPALDEFTELAARDPSRWSTLRAILHAGSKVAPSALQRFGDVIGERYLEAWGMTEISGVLAATTTVIDYRERWDDPTFYARVGRPVPDVIVRLVDDDRNDLPHDGTTVGELVVKSSSTMAGYYGKPEATAKALVDGWYYTGDLGSIAPDGMVGIVDRRHDMIVSGGMNVYPAEIELALRGLDGIADCAVVAGPHERWGQTPVAVVVAKPDAELSEEGIIEYSRAHLASYKKPTRVLFIDELPRTTSGKVQRGVLRDLVAAK
jgi:acyl-CoA synthetase (AMP-forming)/AMP-acid ligase II